MGPVPLRASKLPCYQILFSRHTLAGLPNASTLPHGVPNSSLCTYLHLSNVTSSHCMPVSIAHLSLNNSRQGSRCPFHAPSQSLYAVSKLPVTLAVPSTQPGEGYCNVSSSFSPSPYLIQTRRRRKFRRVLGQKLGRCIVSVQ